MCKDVTAATSTPRPQTLNPALYLATPSFRRLRKQLRLWGPGLKSPPSEQEVVFMTNQSKQAGMYVYIYIHTCTYIYTNVFKYMTLSLSLYIYIYIYTCILNSVLLCNTRNIFLRWPGHLKCTSLYSESSAD